MKAIVMAMPAVFALGLHSQLFAAEPASILQNIAGKYAGELELYNKKNLKKYDYSIEITTVDTGKKELSLKTQCDQCEVTSVSYSGCRITEGSPETRILCTKKGGGDVEYLLSGDTIKSKDYNRKGLPTTVIVKKQAQ